MTDHEFSILQYKSLRAEIKESKARMHKTLLFGLTVSPAASTLAQVMEIDFLLLLIPLFVLMIGLLYLSDSHSVMRCGTYIKDHIENAYKEGKGWEEWLYSEGQLRQRSVDIFLMASFYLLFVVYYVSTTYMAAISAKEKYGLGFFSMVTGAYTAVGVVFLTFLALNFRACTQTRAKS